MPDASQKITTAALRARKASPDKIAVVTAYDVVFARLADEAGLDVVLVGDSLGMVVQGESTTLPVTLDEMVYHTRIVSRGVRRAEPARGAGAAESPRAVPAVTIGIGAGGSCDGQVMVMHDLLGLEPSWKPRFVRRYAEMGKAVGAAFAAYAADVRAGRFPSDDESYD